MHILLDDGLSTTVALTGIGHQCLELHKHLSKLTEVMLTDYHYLRSLPKPVRRGAYLVIANMRRDLSRYDVLHFINYYTPKISTAGAKVTTIHDLSMFRFPELLSSFYRRYIQRAVIDSLQRADLVIVPSYATRKEITALFPKFPASKIAVCFNGLRDIFRRKLTTEKMGNFKLASDDFFLYVGALESRKRIDFLLDCFCEARKTGAIASKTSLVLAGRRGPGYEHIEHRIPNDGSVQILGHVSDLDLVCLYHRAKAFIYPSMCEGFGIPLIEAMSCVLPIIRSEIDSSAELDERHNAQMFTFSFDSYRTLIERLAELDHAAEQIRKNLNYGDLTIYNFSNVAQQHLHAYQVAVDLKKRAQ